MAGRMRVLIGGLGLAALIGCAGQQGPAPAGAGGAGTEKTIVVGASRIDPDDTTMSASQSVAFVNTGLDPVQVEFTNPAQQAGKITCRVTDPKQLPKGEAAWAEFRPNSIGHLMAEVPPGRFPSTCTFAPGGYAFVVKVLSMQIRTDEEKLGAQGTITVK